MPVVAGGDGLPQNAGVVSLGLASLPLGHCAASRTYDGLPRSYPLLSKARVTLFNGEQPALTASCAFGGLLRAAVRANAERVSTSHGPISLSSKDDHDEGCLHRVEPFAPRFHNRRTYQLKRRQTSWCNHVEVSETGSRPVWMENAERRPIVTTRGSKRRRADPCPRTPVQWDGLSAGFERRVLSFRPINQ
jgi:hypothetical protein